jgi:surfeit locus 1 family protein
MTSESQPSGTAKPKSASRVLSGLVLVTICLGMAGLQWWRAQTRGALYAQQQIQALAQPTPLNDALRDRDALVWKPVSARGTFLPEHTIFLDNKIYRQRPGYHVLTPLRLSGSNAVILVNRGWMPAPRLRSDIPRIKSPAGEVHLTGIARPYQDGNFSLGDTKPEGPIWQLLREADYRAHSQLDTLPWILLQQSASEPVRVNAALANATLANAELANAETANAETANDALVRDWTEITPPGNPALRHYGYMTMWLVFALMAVGYGALAWRKSQ